MIHEHPTLNEFESDCNICICLLYCLRTHAHTREEIDRTVLEAVLKTHAEDEDAMGYERRNKKQLAETQDDGIIN